MPLAAFGHLRSSAKSNGRMPHDATMEDGNYHLTDWCHDRRWRSDRHQVGPEAKSHPFLFWRFLFGEEMAFFHSPKIVKNRNHPSSQTIQNQDPQESTWRSARKAHASKTAFNVRGNNCKPKLSNGPIMSGQTISTLIQALNAGPNENLLRWFWGHDSDPATASYRSSCSTEEELVIWDGVGGKPNQI